MEELIGSGIKGSFAIAILLSSGTFVCVDVTCPPMNKRKLPSFFTLPALGIVIPIFLT